jgi:hypothetical protein
MGLIYVIKTRKAAEAPEYPYADDDVIELWEDDDVSSNRSQYHDESWVPADRWEV